MLFLKTRCFLGMGPELSIITAPGSGPAMLGLFRGFRPPNLAVDTCLVRHSGVIGTEWLDLRR
jgi:hypothetical protein